jgi:hypothetical protein
MKHIAPIAVAAMLSLLVTPIPAGASSPAGRPDVREPAGKRLLGWVERALITGAGISVKAKLDSGARTSSLDARNIERFSREGTAMVRFEFINPGDGRRILIERPVVRNVRIREHGGSYQRRPVVEVWLCVGDVARFVEVTLVDRSGFIYPLLIGRKAMAGAIVIDPEETFTSIPTCRAGGSEL